MHKITRRFGDCMLVVGDNERVPTMVRQNINLQCRYFGLLIWTLIRRAARVCCNALSLLFPHNPQHKRRIYRIMGRTCLCLVDISPCLLLSAIVSQLIVSRVNLQMLIACHISVVCLKFQVSIPNCTPCKHFL